MRKSRSVVWLLAANIGLALAIFARPASAAQAGWLDCCERLNESNVYVCVDNGCFFTHDCAVNQDCVRTTI
jgi:hypothetical protein